MAFWVNITYAAGTFGATVSTLDIFSNYDSYATAVATGVAKASLVSGYALSVPDGTTTVRVKGTGTCVGSYQDIVVSGAPSPTPAPAAPTPTPAAPTPTPAAPTPAAPTPTPAAPTPTPAAPPPTPSLTSFTLGYSSSDGDIACTNYETNVHVTKYAASALGNGVTIWNNSDGTGVPTDGYYARGGDYWYSTSGVLGSETVCYGGSPTPAAPTPTPTPTPTPAAAYDYYDYERCENPNAYGGAIYSIPILQGNGAPPTIIVDGACHSLFDVTAFASANYSIPAAYSPVNCTCV